MVGLKDKRMLDMIAEWRKRPEIAGKKYMCIESMTWHMSIYPVMFNEELDIRMHILRNERNPESGCTVLYVINLTTDELVYSRHEEIDELAKYDEESLIIVDSMSNLSDQIIHEMRRREIEKAEFKQLRDELRVKFAEDAHKRLAERYAHHVEECTLLGYEIKPYYDFMNSLSDEDKHHIYGDFDLSIFQD